MIWPDPQTAARGSVMDQGTQTMTAGAEKPPLDSRDEVGRALGELSPAMLWMGDETGKCVFLNRAQRDFWGVDPPDLGSFVWSATVHPDDVEKLAAPFMDAMARQVPFEVSARYRRFDGEYRTLLTKANPRFDPVDGRFIGMTGVNTDITEQLEAEEQTRFLMGELNHRTKNILAVVQAIARQTAKHASPDSFHAVFGNRIGSLAASNDLLLRNSWTGVMLHDLVEAQLPHLKDLIGSRILPSGPPVTVSTVAAQTLGMAFHELSTNSIKYGALSEPGGIVDIRWSRSEAGSPLVIAWTERGGPPALKPERKGFGHTVIVDMVAAALDAEVTTSYESTGFRWVVTTRSDRAIASPPTVSAGSSASPG